MTIIKINPKSKSKITFNEKKPNIYNPREFRGTKRIVHKLNDNRKSRNAINIAMGIFILGLIGYGIYVNTL